MTNALMRRDYFITGSGTGACGSRRDHQPRHLLNNLTIENIKAGNFNMRNFILASVATKPMPFHALGSGLLRTLCAWPDIEFIDDRAGNLFKVIVTRPDALLVVAESVAMNAERSE